MFAMPGAGTTGRRVCFPVAQTAFLAGTRNALSEGLGAWSRDPAGGGGLVPFNTTSAYISTGSLAWALAYPIGLPAVMFLLALFLMPETRKHSIWGEGAIEAARGRA
jgi:hypothetical protein